MVIVVDLVEGTSALIEPSVMTALAVSVRGAGDDALVASTIGGGARATGDGHIFLPPELIRTLAGDAATPSWLDDLDAMVRYAGSKGWQDEHGAVRAHVERDPTSAAPPGH